ncbi:hypothetical protein ACKVWM_002597 [Pyricularia oryzae]
MPRLSAKFGLCPDSFKATSRDWRDEVSSAVIATLVTLMCLIIQRPTSQRPYQCCSVDSLGREKAATADVANGTRDLTEPKTGFRAALGRVPRKPFLMIWYMIALELRDIVELLYWFGIGIFWLVQDKHFGHAEMEHPQEKAQEVGFAQLIPLILLVLPLMQLVESYARLSDRKYDAERERDTEHVPGG